MSSSSNRDPPPSEDDTSYVKMRADTTDNDATLIGEHCQAAYCNQLDFLPFQCQSCWKTFCGDHRTETAHACANPGAWAERKRLASLAKPAAGAGKTVRDRDLNGQPRPCAYYDKSCKTVIGTSLVPGVRCEGCNRAYCLKHRLREEHNCANLPPLGGPRPTAAFEKSALGALKKLQLWGSEKKKAVAATTTRAFPKPKPSSAAQRMVALNNLKKTAKGDAKLAPEKRVYLFVEAEAETAEAKLPKGEFFYSKDWVVGRLLDAAAKSLQVQNVNNQSSDERDKLRVFHVEGGRVLEFNEKVGTTMQNGNTIVLLRGVGPPPDLIEV